MEKTSDPHYYGADQMQRIAVGDALIDQYNKMSAHGGTDMFVIPKADLQVILEALGLKIKLVET